MRSFIFKTLLTGCCSSTGFRFCLCTPKITPITCISKKEMQHRVNSIHTIVQSVQLIIFRPIVLGSNSSRQSCSCRLFPSSWGGPGHEIRLEFEPTVVLCIQKIYSFLLTANIALPRSHYEFAPFRRKQRSSTSTT